tara:strand:+ start:9307 stop:9543 length:237 start_codon:yes stop_codon:yes gene_type:complete
MKKVSSTNNVSKAVEIVLGVIDHMNLTEQEKLVLVEKLSGSTTSKVSPKPMTEEELYIRKFEKWLIEKKKLFPPKQFQ